MPNYHYLFLPRSVRTVWTLSVFLDHIVHVRLKSACCLSNVCCPQVGRADSTVPVAHQYQPHTWYGLLKDSWTNYGHVQASNHLIQLPNTWQLTVCHDINSVLHIYYTTKLTQHSMTYFKWPILSCVFSHSSILIFKMVKKIFFKHLQASFCWRCQRVVMEVLAGEIS